MGRICKIKKQVRHKEWAAMVSDCQASGKKVEEWCAENSINVSTYYKRLNVLRSELIDEADTAIPNAVGSSEDKIIMRKDGIDVYTAPTATAARNICHTLPLTAHGHCPAKYDILDMARQ